MSVDVCSDMSSDKSINLSIKANVDAHCGIFADPTYPIDQTMTSALGRPVARKQNGFTLLEIMVAMFIFAVAGAAIIKTTTEHINSVGKLEEITFATWVANNQLMRASLSAEKTWPPKNNERGSVEMLDRTWYWQQEVQTTNDENLKAVVMTVGNDPEYEGSIISVTTYVAKSNG